MLKRELGVRQLVHNTRRRKRTTGQPTLDVDVPLKERRRRTSLLKTWESLALVVIDPSGMAIKAKVHR